MQQPDIKFLLITFLLIGFSSCSNPDEKPKSNQLQTGAPVFEALSNRLSIDKALDSLVDHNLVPFVYARIEAADGSQVYEHHAVNQKLYPNLAINKDSWFRVWSMSKIVTITTVMDLEEDGVLKLSDPVHKYIPEFKDLKVARTRDGSSIVDVPWDKREAVCPIQLVTSETEMTIAHLINHEAGFYYPWTNIACLDSIWKAQDLNDAENTQDLIERMSQMPLVQQPGHTYYYGLNTTVLGLVAERATGKSLKQLVEERITQPLNIKGLQYSLPNDISLLPRTAGGDSLSKVDSSNEQEILGAKLPDYDPTHQLYLGGEGMLATTDGYADFARMLLHRGSLNSYQLLEDSTIEEMSMPHTQLDSPWGYNGYNLWVTGDTLKAMGIGEAGLWVGGGYEGTYFWIDRKRNFVGLVMTQLFRMQTSPADVFRKAVYQELWAHENEANH